METTGIPNNLELQRILSACYDYWQTEPLPPQKRAVCYSWVKRRYCARFGEGFHPSRLRQLARLGFLEKEGVSRGGSRRYYRIIDPVRLAALLRECSLS
jgi:hypothetical protein